jgi:glutathionyl-hydroquinone reductase
MLVDGKWSEKRQPVQATDARGGFVRRTSAVRRFVGEPGFEREAERYRAGFATTQEAYEAALYGVFDMLDELEERLEGHPYLVGDRLTEVDIRVFVTLVRFDVAYHGLFETNLRRIADYPRLSAYLRRLLEEPAFAKATNLEHIEHIEQGYHSIEALDPSRIVPVGPLDPYGLVPKLREAPVRVGQTPRGTRRARPRAMGRQQ